jgi:hypothetical protein
MKTNRIALALLAIVAFAAVASADVVIDGADYWWDGTPITGGGMARIIVDNRAGTEDLYVGSATFVYDWGTEHFSSNYDPTLTPWAGMVDHANHLTGELGVDWWVCNGRWRHNADGTWTIAPMAEHYYFVDGVLRVDQAEGYVPKGTAFDYIMRFPGETAFHSPLEIEVDGQIVSDHNPLPNTGALPPVPEPVTLVTLAASSLIILRRRSQ